MIITKKGVSQSTISIEENFRAPRDKVFKAWTTPDSLKKWFMADEGVVVTEAKVNLSIGGLYLIKAQFPGYDPTPIHGQFLKVDKPEQLEYTWQTPALQERVTKVEVAFVDQPKGSKIVLSHGEFKTAEEMQLHIDGWVNCLNKLREFL